MTTFFSFAFPFVVFAAAFRLFFLGRGVGTELSIVKWSDSSGVTVLSWGCVNEEPSTSSDSISFAAASAPRGVRSERVWLRDCFGVKGGRG